jgi:hypothetical protein
VSGATSQEILEAASEAREVAARALDHARAASGQSAVATGRADRAADTAQKSETSAAQAMMVAVEVHAELRAAAGLEPDPDHIFKATQIQLALVSTTAREAADSAGREAGEDAGRLAAEAVVAEMPDQIAQLQAQVVQLLYVPPAITAFSASPAVAEVGASVAQVTLAVTRSRMDLPVQITGTSTATIPAGQSSITVAGPFTAASSWTARVTDPAPPAGQADTATASAALTFRHRRYWGVSASQALDGAGILALGNSEFATGFGPKSVTYNCDGGRYPYYAYPAAWGTPDGVSVGGLAFSDVTVTDIPFVNASGATETFRVLRFGRLQNGSAIQVVWQ